MKVIQVFIGRKTFWEVANPRLKVSLSLLSVQEKKCGFITHAGQKRLSLFFFLRVLFTETACERHPGRHVEPETLGYNQTQEPQHPDSATTITDGCSDSVRSKKRFTAIYSNDFLYNEQPGPPSFPADFLKGGATFQWIINLNLNQYNIDKATVCSPDLAWAQCLWITTRTSNVFPDFGLNCQLANWCGQQGEMLWNYW